ncbi:hypothetical protein P3T35_001383 [Kitasatospora sp. GP30]|nr:hypothetical protein [Kitasatospora sp. GP30]
MVTPVETMRAGSLGGLLMSLVLLVGALGPVGAASEPSERA